MKPTSGKYLLEGEAERFIIKSTLEVTDGPLGYIPLAANSTRRVPIFHPNHLAQ